MAIVPREPSIYVQGICDMIYFETSSISKLILVNVHVEGIKYFNVQNHSKHVQVNLVYTIR